MIERRLSKLSPPPRRLDLAKIKQKRSVSRGEKGKRVKRDGRERKGWMGGEARGRGGGKRSRRRENSLVPRPTPSPSTVSSYSDQEDDQNL